MAFTNVLRKKGDKCHPILDKLWMATITAFLLMNYFQIQMVLSHGIQVAPLLLISFDGFRWDYTSKFKAETVNLNKIITEGVHAKQGMKNIFETVTIPNHWSLVTGLYSESHGISSNVMYDPILKEDFFPEWRRQPNHHNDYRFFDAGGEPIWVTSQLQNMHARTGSVMWLGSEQPVKWVKSTYFVEYSFGYHEVSFEQRVDYIVNWFSQEHPINLGLMYFSEPDFTAHKNGIDADDTRKMIKIVDNAVGYLFKRLEEKDLLDDINIIITSDHGFVDLPKSKYIMMDEIVPPKWYQKIITPSPVFSVIPNPGMEEKIYQRLKQAADKPDSHFQVFKKEDIPDRFHFKHNPRVQPVIALADLQYTFIVNKTADEYDYLAGHGYDNEHQEMRPFFVATGPSFKKGFAVDTFNIVDVYPLMCHLLHLTPAPNNGSLNVVSSLLIKHETTMWTFLTYIVTLIVIASVGGVYLVTACRQRNYLKRMKKNAKSSSPHIIRYSSKSKGAPYAKMLTEVDADEEDDDIEMMPGITKR